MKRILDGINSPADLHGLSAEERKTLCGEIREEIIGTVSRNGGHLSPNLGVVELTVALEYVFGGKDDSIIWDVGHQTYAHKMLTGRLKAFHSLRRFRGLSGFQSPEESPADPFFTGHAGVAISEALGLAEANARTGREGTVVAVVGDGSLGCGISMEALNNLRNSRARIILIINDNKMSISKSVGAVSTYLNHVITGRRYNYFKTSLKLFLRKFPFGRTMISGIRRLETATKSLFVSGAVFEGLGMKYVGPIDGHNLPELIDKLSKVREITAYPVVVHVITQKGHGCRYAEENPELYHGCGPFAPETGRFPERLPELGPTFSQAFAAALTGLAGRHGDVVAITAAMSSGTKLCEFQQKFPERFHDVGIAEEHAIAFASGLAAGGLRPVVAIYATFLQRALDNVFHDICLQDLPVILCVDRAGIVEDGPTHHGIYDLPFFLAMPNLTILLPRDASELAEMLSAAYIDATPVMIRYPRGAASDLDAPRHPFKLGRADEIRSGSEVAIWCAGRECETGLKVAELLADQGISASVANIRSLKPFDTRKLITDAASRMVVTIEDSQNGGGLASLVDSTLVNAVHGKIFHFGWSRGRFIPHGGIAELRHAAGLDPENIAETIKNLVRPS